MSDQLEPDLERVARMLAEAGPLPDAPATLRERALAIPDGGPVAVADLAAAARTRRRRQRPRPPRCSASPPWSRRSRSCRPCSSCATTAAALRASSSLRAPFAPKGGGNASIVTHDDGSATISLRVWKMPQPDAAHAYEAWLGRTGDRKPLGTFATDASGAATVSFDVPRSEVGRLHVALGHERAGRRQRRRRASRPRSGAR